VLGKIFDRAIGVLAFIAGILLIFAMLLVVYEALMRYFFGESVAWAIEICEDVLLFIAFLGAAWLLKREGHVAVDIVHACMKPKAQVALDIITSALGVIVCLVLTWYSAGTTLDHFERGAKVVKSLTLPKAMLLAIIPIGFFALSIQFLRRTHGYVRTWKAPGKKDPDLRKDQ
jgi:C4-dicarboxylate transporter DctQ subunit